MTRCHFGRSKFLLKHFYLYWISINYFGLCAWNKHSEIQMDCLREITNEQVLSTENAWSVPEKVERAHCRVLNTWTSTDGCLILFPSVSMILILLGKIMYQNIRPIFISFHITVLYFVIINKVQLGLWRSSVCIWGEKKRKLLKVVWLRRWKGFWLLQAKYVFWAVSQRAKSVTRIPLSSSSLEWLV